MTNPIIEQLAQQLGPESSKFEQLPDGMWGLLAKSAAKPEYPPCLGSAPECEQEQELGLISLIVKGD